MTTPINALNTLDKEDQLQELAAQKEQQAFKMPAQEIGSQGFLTLLMEQMKHQDIENPMESTEFASQLATFSSLANSAESLKYQQRQIELLEGMNEKLNQLSFLESKDEEWEEQLAFLRGIKHSLDTLLEQKRPQESVITE